MYLVAVHVPIYTAGERTFAATDWKRSLALLRDSLEGRYGPVWVLSPTLPAEGGDSGQRLEEVSEADEDIRLLPSFDRRCRAREYWLRQRFRWKADLRRLVPQAEVVHAGMCDVYRPINFAAHLEGLRQGRPTVFVNDTDIAGRAREESRRAAGRRRVETRLYAWCFERCVRYGVRTAALSLLKGRAVYDRYRRYARNARIFQDVSCRRGEMAPPEAVEARIAELRGGGRAVRLVYAGRLVERKGVDHAIRIVAQAGRLGAGMALDVIGDGPQRRDLERLAAAEGAADRVRFLGAQPYGPPFIAQLAGYDAILFTPRSEDTPRMIFDGYAAGLPLVAYAIPYVRERQEEDKAAVLLPRDDVDAGARALLELDRNRGELARLARAALEAGRFHSADNWYRRRAEWTFEAVGRFHHELHRR